MNPSIWIRTLGEFTIQTDDEIVPGFASRKAEALLVYLAVERGTAHRRESLFTLLWPGMPEGSARNNLRQVLFNIRHTLKDAAGDDTTPTLLSDRQTIQLNPDADLDIDIHKFDRLLEGTRVHDHLNLSVCETCTEALQNAVDLYQGNFLADFYLEDSNQYENWTQAIREAYRRKALDTLSSLTEINLQMAVFEQARTYADRQIQIDPLRESAYRQLMEIHAKAGQPAEALRTYQRCLRVLEIELGTKPSRETSSLFEIISGEDLQQTATTPWEGSIRGYQIREHLGSGHTGAVYRSFQPIINRDVAVKVILPQFANHPDFIRRFEVEAQLIARLEHPHIVPLYDYWRDPTGAYLVMRWLRGGSLQASLDQGAWKPMSAVKLVNQIASALSLAHKHGVVHCDIKPANILLDESRNAYLSDFSIAILTGPLAQLSQVSGGNDSSSGSLGYTSPEVTRGLDTTPLADIYSLGVVLYEIITGAHPFPGLAGEALVVKHLTEPLPSVLRLRPDLPPGVDDVIQKATQKDPSQRYHDVDNLAIAFRQALAPETITLVSEPEVPLDLRNPYKGLRPFQEADSSDFFGRDELVERMVKRLAGSGTVPQMENRFLAVVGPSGSGKSSVIKAGLIPAIRSGAIPGSERWFIAEMTPGAHPMVELETALLRIAIDTPTDLLDKLQSDPNGLLKILRKAFPGVKDDILLVIDQFEELFTLVEDQSERDHFLDILVTAVSDPDTTLRVVITLRADFYDRPLQHSAFGELVQRGTEVVLPLSTIELERAICGPAERVGVTLEGALVARIVQEVADQPGALPLLQYALTELFEHREGNMLTLVAYEKGGGVLGALGRRAEAIYSELKKSQQLAVRQLFLRLVTLGEGIEDIRRRTLLSELLTLDDLGGRLSQLLDVFTRSRLLTLDYDPATRGPTVEVTHEALIREWSRLGIWLDESRDDIRLQRLLASASQEWLESNRDPGFLLRGARLGQFSEWSGSTQVSLTADERAYLDASLVARRKREQDVLRQVSIGLASQALAQIRTANSERSVLLALAALEEYPYTSQAEAALARAVQESLPYKRFFDEKGYNLDGHWVDWSPDGKRVALGTRENIDGEHSAVVFNFESGEIDLILPLVISNTYEVECSVQQINWSPDGTNLALAVNNNYLEEMGSHEHLLQVYTVSSGELLLDLDSQGEFAVDWSPDGSKLLTGGENGAVRVWDSQTGEILMDLVGHAKNGGGIYTDKSDWVFASRFSPDGKQAATFSIGGLVHIWDAATGELLQTLEHPPEYVTDIFYNGGTHKIGLAWSPDGNRIATAWYDGMARVWDLATGQVSRLLAGHSSNLIGIDWSPDGVYILSQGREATARLWSASTGQMVARLPTHGFGNAAWSHDGRWIAVPLSYGLLTWDTSTLPPILNPTKPSAHRIWEAQWTPDGKLLVLSGQDGLVFDWLEDKTSWNVAPSDYFFANSPDSTRMIAMDYENWKRAQVIDIYSGEVLSELDSPTTDDPYFQWATHSWSNDGTIVASGSYPEYWTVIWDPVTGEEMARTETVGGFMQRAQFSPDDTILAAPSVLSEGNSSVYLIDTKTGKILMELPSEDGWSIVAMWSSDGRTLAVGYQSGVIKLWDTQDWTVKSTLTGHQGAIWDLNWSPNGQRIVSGDYDNSVVHIWEVATGEIVMTWDMQGQLLGGFNDTDWSPDGQFILIHGIGDMPFIRRVWQSTEELIDYAYEFCVWRDLTPEEREQFGLPEKQ